jgi:hypothetical protein
MPTEKHFVDTSVLRPLISSSSVVKKYYNEKFGGKVYYCSYVKMEFIRGYIIPTISFYFTLRLPKITCISDAISLWSQKFQTRELKAVLSMLSGLLSNHNFDFNDLNNKELALQRIADYIRRILTIVENKYKDIGIERTLCSKSILNINFDPINIDVSFKEFIDAFSKKDWKSCNINSFLIKNKNLINKIIEYKEIDIPNSNPEGFIKIIEELETEKNNTCKRCKLIGDLVISIISPKDMKLEHTDYSFDYLMTIFEKDHFRHPSEQKLIIS